MCDYFPEKPPTCQMDPVSRTHGGKLQACAFLLGGLGAHRSHVVSLMSSVPLELVATIPTDCGSAFGRPIQWLLFIFCCNKGKAGRLAPTMC